MKNLNSIIKNLKSHSDSIIELNREEMKHIRGAEFSSKAECEANCRGNSSSNGWWHYASSCYEWDGEWHCKDS